MIIDGNEHGNAGNLARYLLTAKEGETVQLYETRGTALDNLTDTLTDWEAIGRSTTRGQNILYHSWLRLASGEKLHEAQWLKTIETLEERLKLTDAPRVIVAHHNEQNGTHFHVVWSRVDPERDRLLNLGNSARKSITVAREAEKEFGLRRLEAVDTKRKEKKRQLSKTEIRAIKDRGANREKLEKAVRAAWSACDGGEEMHQMLAALKVTLEPGDRRAWVVEYAGVKVNPVRLLEGVTEAQFRERMKDYEPTTSREKEQTSPAQVMFKRDAKFKIRNDLENQSVANDAQRKGFRLKRHKAPQPKLKPKLWYGDRGF